MGKQSHEAGMPHGARQSKIGGMIIIRPIQPEEIPAAKRLILGVAYRLLGWEGTLEDSITYFEAKGEFRDMDQVESAYFGNGGLFLAALNDVQLVGTGAVRRLDETTAELKRMWLLEEYQGKGIGFALITRLFQFAREQGYRKIVLQTEEKQARAVKFYYRLGFREVPNYNEKQGNLNLGLELTDNKLKKILGISPS